MNNKTFPQNQLKIMELNEIYPQFKKTVERLFHTCV